jgi:5-methyltetrahydrofolate--homocysteine methyltransferase
MNKFLDALESGKTLVADGSTGISLLNMGVPPGTIPEELVIDQPDLVFNLEKAFVEAGSDIILTCTFGGTSLRLKESRYRDRTTEINHKAVEIARKATALGKGVLVAGSIGPTGQVMKPYGPLLEEQALASFTEQARALTEAGVDLLVIETMFAFNEADAAYQAARSTTDLPIVVSFSYDRGIRTMMGVKPADMLQHYRDMGAVMIGANCGTTLENMELIQKEYAATGPGALLWAKPNAGMPHTDGVTTTYDITPAQMAEYARKYVAIGARVVGGCCGSTPAHIAAIAKAVKP